MRENKEEIQETKNKGMKTANKVRRIFGGGVADFNALVLEYQTIKSETASEFEINLFIDHNGVSPSDSITAEVVSSPDGIGLQSALIKEGRGVLMFEYDGTAIEQNDITINLNIEYSGVVKNLEIIVRVSQPGEEE